MEKFLKQVVENKILNEKTALKQNARYFIEYNSDLQTNDGADTFTSYNWTIDKNGNIYPYTMISFSMRKESMMGVDPLNPAHDELRNAVAKIRKIFDI